MTKGKKAVIIGGIVLASFVMFGYKKFDTAKKVLANLDFSIHSISKFRLGVSKISFDAVISLINPTNLDFGATTSSYITLKEVRVYSSTGQYLGKAASNFYQIKLPANSQVNLDPINFSLNSFAAISEFLGNADMYLAQDFSRLKFQVSVDAFGQMITIDV